MSTDLSPEILTRDVYELFRKLVFDQSGINLGEHKMQLVRARLGKHVRKGGFASFRDYYEHVRSDSSGTALSEMLDSITTNTTHLFREGRHFDRLREFIQGWVRDSAWRRAHQDMRIWCAASSTGEEPYSIAMTAHDAVERSGVEIKILATDISTRVLEIAKRGEFEPNRVSTVPANFRGRYLERVGTGRDTRLRVTDDLRRLVTFARLNLMATTFPFRKRFDVIFCRNVMIYFDKPTQQGLVNRMFDHLHSGGYLLIGHSESLNGVKHPFTYVEPTIYRKP